jgi:uncharacterized protein
MKVVEIFHNIPLEVAIIAWLIAQIIKLPLTYITTGRWNWALLFSPGGLPSSHSALVAGAAHMIGLTQGFDSPLFAIAMVLAIVVIYDATGIRRQAGRHAKIINKMILDMSGGQPIKQEQLREVLGHTPLEALAGTLLGIGLAQVAWWMIS